MTIQAIKRPDKWTLDEKGEPTPENDLIRWARWFETSSRIIAQEVVGNSKVSTVFLGLDHNFDEEGPPILWESMVFGGPLDQEMDRCSGNRQDAEAMHKKMISKVQST